MDGSSSPSAAGTAIDPELAPIASICAGRVERHSEGAKNFILMLGLKFLVRDGTGKHRPRQMDALLCLNHGHPTYQTKLYLAEKIEGLSLNWNETSYILARQWQTWSWKEVSPNQTPMAILAGHLKAFL